MNTNCVDAMREALQTIADAEEGDSLLGKIARDALAAQPEAADSRWTTECFQCGQAIRPDRLTGTTCACSKPEAAVALAGEGVLREALQDIADWKLPETGEFWPSGSPVSYEAQYGSNGVRDYIRGVARAALSAAPVAAQQPAVVGDGDVEGRVALALYLRDGGSKATWGANLAIRSAYRDEAKTALAALTPAATQVPVGGEGDLMFTQADMERFAGYVADAREARLKQQGPVGDEAWRAHVEEAVGCIDIITDHPPILDQARRALHRALAYPPQDGQPLTVENAPVGTRAPALMGGHWYRVQHGWKWNGPDGNGGVFPRPGGDWMGNLIGPQDGRKGEAE